MINKVDILKVREIEHYAYQDFLYKNVLYSSRFKDVIFTFRDLYKWRYTRNNAYLLTYKVQFFV